MRISASAGRPTAPDEGGAIDILTGLGNRCRLFHAIEDLIRERADDPAPFTVAILDLDGFKPINDLFGRKAGDDMLRQIARRLAAGLDRRSVVCRVGADEFGFLFPLVFTEASAAKRAHQLIDLLSGPYEVGDRTARLSASVGCSVFVGVEEDAEALVAKAETALYNAKRSGRGRVAVYTSAMEEAAKHVTRVEQALRRAVAAGEVEPHFQPIVDLRTRRILGVETLARWTDPVLGPVSPDVFIPIAEDRGVIGPLSQLLLAKAASAARLWPPDLFLSFNLSPSQLVDHNTASQILSILADTGFDPARFEIEITESGLMSDPASAAKIIDDLRGRKISISLDDFGTGQSSLGRLRQFRFDKLKIDRSFVQTLLADLPSEHIVRAILGICDGLGMTAVAEGIEAEAQAERLLAFGCAGGQGFLFGRPSDAAETEALFRSRLPGAGAA